MGPFPGETALVAENLEPGDDSAHPAHSSCVCVCVCVLGVGDCACESVHACVLGSAAQLSGLV